MKFLTAAVISFPLLAQQLVVTPVTSSESAATIRAQGPAGERMLPAKHLLTDSTGRNGKPQREDLVVVFDPETGHYYWRLTRAGQGDAKPLGVFECDYHKLYIC